MATMKAPLDTDDFLRYMRVKVVLDAGWTFEQVDNCILQDLLDLLAVKDGLARAEESARKRASRRGSRRK
jgi:hypothetical protein